MCEGRKDLLSPVNLPSTILFPIIPRPPPPPFFSLTAIYWRRKGNVLPRNLEGWGVLSSSLAEQALPLSHSWLGLIAF